MHDTGTPGTASNVQLVPLLMACSHGRRRMVRSWLWFFFFYFRPSEGKYIHFPV
uniref:Uncharacterized protein n=1 Tax=Anguilla anguilla TaxID=7936 RepID=A0A0E9R4I8_ANGAN